MTTEFNAQDYYTGMNLKQTPEKPPEPAQGERLTKSGVIIKESMGTASGRDKAATKAMADIMGMLE